MRIQTNLLLKPLWQLFRRGFGIRRVSKCHVVSGGSFYKALGLTIGPRAPNGRSNGLEIHFSSKFTNLFVCVPRVVIGQEPDLSGRGKYVSKRLFKGRYQHVLEQDPINTRDHDHLADFLFVATHLKSRNADILFFPVINLKPTGAPAGIIPINRYPAVMGLGVAPRPVEFGQREIIFSHDPADSFAFGGTLPMSMSGIANHGSAISYVLERRSKVKCR
jgi:hypothetical protein